MANSGWQVFAWIIEKFETPFTTAVEQGMNSLLAAAEGPVRLCAVLFIILYGVAILTGRAQPGPDMIGQAAKVGFVTWFAFSGFTTYAYDFMFVGFPQWLTSQVAGTPLTSSAFDGVWLKAWEAGLLTWQALDKWELMEKAAVLVFWCVSAVSTLFCFGLWMVSRVLLGLTVIIGPLFVAAYFFQATRGFVERWVGAMVGAVILQVGAIIMLSTMVVAGAEIIGTITSGSKGGNPWANLQTIFSGVIFFGFAIFASAHLTGWAAQFAGGLSFHAGGIARATYGAAGNAAKAAGIGGAKMAGAAAMTGIQRGAQAASSFRRSGGSVSRSTGASLGDGPSN